jgi:hypothetical protein
MPLDQRTDGDKRNAESGKEGVYEFLLSERDTCGCRHVERVGRECVGEIHTEADTWREWGGSVWGRDTRGCRERERDATAPVFLVQLHVVVCRAVQHRRHKHRAHPSQHGWRRELLVELVQQRKNEGSIPSQQERR